MTASAAFRAFIEDHLSGLGRISTRPMFGGAGVCLHGVMFALIAGDVLYLKVDEGNKARFAEAGSAPFTYEGKAKPVSMSYWRAPEHLLEDREEMALWARTSLDAARRGKTRS